MKLQVTFKTPDALDYVMKAEIDSLLNCYETEDITELSEREEKAWELKEEIEKTTDLFVKYGECVTIEFDTETKTAIVLKIK